MTQNQLSKLSAEELASTLTLISARTYMSEWEAAIYSSRTITAMRELRYKRKIAYVKDGRTIKYRRADLDKYHESKIVPAK
jgi:hypothetical protein